MAGSLAYLLLLPGMSGRAALAQAAQPSGGSGGAAGQPAGSADPFYLDLLRDGIQSYDRGEPAAAARSLRLACFGLLDEPNLLGGCLARLALAQDKAGDTEGFRDTFRRLAEVEERFAGYSQAELPPEARAALEQRLAAVLPPATLAGVPAFRRLATRRAETELAAMPPKQRRRELEQRIASSPREPLWQLLAGELDLEEGRAPQALSRAEQALALGPGDARALCLRGSARAATGRCGDAVGDLSSCTDLRRQPNQAAALLGCWVALGDWQRADSLLRSLPPEVAADRAVARLARQVREHPGPVTQGSPKPAGSAGTAPASASRQETGPTTAPPAGASSSGAARALSPAEAADLARVRGLLAEGKTRTDLRQAFDLAHSVADAHPDLAGPQELAGEAAYRIARWHDAITYFRRGGGPGEDQPDLLFYMAVSLYESGDRRGAAAALQRALPRLSRTPYVEEYVKKIGK